jgi:hypothetical protein
MRVSAALGAALVLAALHLVPAAAPASSRTLLALRSGGGTRELLHVDARTLAPVDDRTVVLQTGSGVVSLSPDGTRVALANGGDVTLVDTVHMEKVGTLRITSAAEITQLVWPTAGRLFALAANEIVVVDPTDRSVVARVPVTGGNSTVVPLPEGIAYLAWSYSGINPSRIVLVRLDGSTRSVTVDRIRAGIRWHRVRGVQVAEISQPGLTADPARGIAYLVGARNLLAEIDLSTLSVTYHTLAPTSSRRLARVEKLLNGPTRFARWLGDGRLAIAGTNASTKVLKNKSVQETWTPTGVAVVDLHSWRSQVIDPAADWFILGDGALVTSTARVVRGFGLDGTPRFATTVDDNVGYVTTFAGYAYVIGAQQDTVLDLASGTIVATVPNPHLYLLGAD